MNFPDWDVCTSLVGELASHEVCELRSQFSTLAECLLCWSLTMETAEELAAGSVGWLVADECTSWLYGREERKGERQLIP